MSFDTSRVCRICLEEGASTTLTSLFSVDFGLTPSVMLTFCTKVQVHINDGMPSHICNNCIYRLGVAYHFKQQCENSDIRLRQYLGIEIKQDCKDAATNTEEIPVIKKDPQIKKPVLKSRIRKSSKYRGKPDNVKSKRGPKPKPKPPQTCFECGKSFKCAAQLEMHVRIHTGERPFACSFCPRRFTQKHNLSIHVRTHTGEKPFQCEICSKQFSALGNFQSHKKIHTGIRDQICPVCNKAFITAGDLSRHLVTHTGIKSHHCNVCGKGFYRTRDMLMHKTKVHNIPKSPTQTSESPATNTIHEGAQELAIDRRPIVPVLLAAPAARRPIPCYREETIAPNGPILLTHTQINY